MTATELLQEWTRDGKIDNTALDVASVKIPVLHGKYLTFQINANLRLKKMNYAIAILERKKWEYFSGKMCDEDMEAEGWEQFDKRILKQDVPRYLEADQDLIRLYLKRDEHKELVDALKSIMSNINGRSFQISNAVKWNIFISGGN